MNTDFIFAEVYVGTYAKYNNGSLDSKWLRLAGYESYADFMAACREVHNDEKEPEFMFQSWTWIPSGLVSESAINPAVWEIIEEVKDMDDEEQDAFCLWMDIYGRCLLDKPENLVERFRDCYMGRYDKEEDFAAEMAPLEFGEQLDTPMGMYFDYAAYARSLLTGPYCQIDEYYFLRP